VGDRISLDAGDGASADLTSRPFALVFSTRTLRFEPAMAAGANSAAVHSVMMKSRIADFRMHSSWASLPEIRRGSRNVTAEAERLGINQA
jgi:hypothetical protein